MPRQGRFKLDNHEVELRSGTIAGEWDIDPDDIESVNYDDTIVVIAIGRVGPPTFKETPNGELKRVDKIQLGATPQVRVAKGEVGYEIADMFGLEVQQQFETGDPDPLAEQEEPEQPEPEPVPEPAEAEEEPEPEPEPEEEPEPELAPKAKKATKKKASGKAARPPTPTTPVAPTSALVGSHVGGANVHDGELAAFLNEPVS